jgi:aryl-alcohol dehydrogenase-like predicted oxidoreductase
VYGLLVHRPDNLLSVGSDRLWDLLCDIKTSGRVSKIGVSVYHPHQLEAVLDRYPIDLVQLPFNAFDQRFTRLLRRLKQAAIEVHARSVFLQGLLLMPPDDLPEYFAPIKDDHARLHAHLKELGLSPLAGCLRYCLAQTDIDKVVVGCDEYRHLAEIVTVADEDGVDETLLQSHAIHDERFIDPSKWPKRTEAR